MGVAESKILAQSLLGACRKAENEGKVRLDGSVFWSDETISKTVKSICRHIPQDIRGPSRKSDVRKAIERSHTKLQVSKVVQDLQDKREILFPARQITHDTESILSFRNIDQNSSLPKRRLDRLACCYIMIARCEDRIELDKIRLRLLYVAFHRLKEKLRDYSGTVPSIADALLSTGSIKDPIDTVQHRVREWIGRGDRYDLLAKDLGGLGVLYILPDLGGESLWSRQLPKPADNESRIAMIQKLEEMGIHAEAQNRNLHKAAEEEMENLLAPLETSVSTVIAQGFSQTPRLDPTQNQPDPELSAHRGTHMSNNASQNPCPLARSQRSTQHSIDCGPLFNWRESGTQHTRNAELASDNAQNTFRQGITNFPLANRAEPIRAQTNRDAFAQDSPTSYDANSMHIWDTNTVVHCSAAQSSDTLNQLQATTDTASSASRLEEALSTGTLTGLGQQADQQRMNDSPQPGFFTVSQAFQGVQYPGYTDTTQALSTDCWDSGQCLDIMPNTNIQISTQPNQTTHVEGIQLASDNIGIGGYRNVYQAVQSSLPAGFTDANSAIQGSWDA